MTSIRLALAAAPAAQVFAVDSQGDPAFRGARIPSGRYARIERAFACAAGDAGTFVITDFEVRHRVLRLPAHLHGLDQPVRALRRRALLGANRLEERERLLALRGVVDDGRGIVAPDDAARGLLLERRHRPRRVDEPVGHLRAAPAGSGG